MGGRFDPYPDSHPVRRKSPHFAAAQTDVFPPCEGCKGGGATWRRGEKAPEGVRTGVRKIAG